MHQLATISNYRQELQELQKIKYKVNRGEEERIRKIGKTGDRIRKIGNRP